MKSLTYKQLCVLQHAMDTFSLRPHLFRGDEAEVTTIEVLIENELEVREQEAKATGKEAQ